MLLNYEESLKNFWDLNNCLDSAERKGFEKGALMEKKENAKKMKSRGFSVQDIADITGLPVSEIENL